MTLPRLLALMVVTLAAAAPVSAAAQLDVGQIDRDARGLTLERRVPFAGLSEVGALSRVWSVNSFYAVFRGDYSRQTVFWAVRRETGDSEGSKVVAWADSRSCPGVERMLTAMEQLPLVRPDAIRLGVESQNLGLVMDGTAHTFWNRWARSGPEDASVGLEITGNVNSPIARWWAEATPGLAGCWTANPPT